MKQDLCY